MTFFMTQPKIFCALDTPDLTNAKTLAGILAPLGIGLKLGLEFFSANGPQGLKAIRDAFPDARLFVDLKFHDIPNTVAHAVRGITRLAPDYLNLHASGGSEMMRMAQEAMLDEAAKNGIKTAPKLLAVTILTSLTDQSLQDIGYAHAVSDQVVKLAQLTQSSGLAGVVCSGHEITSLRKTLGPDFVLMVPGIRPADADVQDQKRVMTPKEALHAGATHLVIGRPITGAADAAEAAQNILKAL